MIEIERLDDTVPAGCIGLDELEEFRGRATDRLHEDARQGFFRLGLPHGAGEVAADFFNDGGVVPERTTMPFQLNASKPGTVSATVGMSGSNDVRLAVVAPSDGSAPDFR